MKKNTLQKVLVSALIGVAAMGTLTACGNSKGAGGIDLSDVGTDFTAFEENVTLKIPVYDRGGDNIPIGQNYWEQWLQENFGNQYNITLEFVPITRSDVLTDYNLLASVDNLPTFMMEYDYPKLAGWVADGSLVPFNMDDFKAIAPTYYQRMVDLDQLKYSEFNGETYFILAERPYYNTNYTFVTWYRMDWLEQVGYDHIPATRAEYLDAMQKIMAAGISAHPGGGSMTLGTQGLDQNYAYRTYPTPDEEWAMYGDYAIPSLGWEPNKLLLKDLNEAYHLGITDPDYFTIDAQTAEANFINGKNYSYSAYIAADMPVLTSFYNTNPDAKLALGIQNNVADTEHGTVPAFRSNNPFGMMIGFSSDTTPAAAKAAMMYMEWMTQEENLFVMQWGFENDNFTYGADGLPESVADYAGEHKQGFNNNKDYWCVTIEARNAGTIEDMIKASSPKGLPQDFTADLIANYYAQVEAWEKGWVPTDAMFATDIKAVNDYQQTLLDTYAEYRDKLVMCKPEEFDAMYEDLAQKYAEAGYQALADERKKAYEDGLVSAQE